MVGKLKGNKNGLKNVYRGLQLVFILTFLMLFGNLDKGFANGSLPFSVEILQTGLQDEEVTGYFSFTPEEDSISDTVRVRLTNESDKEVTVIADVVDAYTSVTGTTYYTKKAEDGISILDDEYKMTNYLKGDTEVVLKPKEMKVVSFDLNIEQGDGVVLGGLLFSEKEDDESGAQEEGFSIKNKIEVLVGVMVNFKTEKEVKFEIGEDIKVHALPAYYTVSLPIELQAPYLKLFDIEYSVEEKGKDEVFKGSIEGQMASYNKTEVELPWESDQIKKNTPYVIKGKLNYTNKKGEKESIEFEREFQFNDKKEKKDNTMFSVPEIVEGGLNIKFILSVLAILIGATLVYRKMLKEKEKEREVEKEE